MKYKVGDKVMVREWNDMVEEFGINDKCIRIRCSFTPVMRKFCGKIVTISDIVDVSEYCYEIEEDDGEYFWTDEMFEDVEQPNIKHWREIAGWYGLEIDEEFDIEDALYNPYKFTEKGLVDCNEDANTIWLDCIINDQCIITKRPWKPKDNDRYFVVNCNGYIDDSPFSTQNMYILAMLKNGWLFRTREEAEANKERVLKEYEEVLK